MKKETLARTLVLALTLGVALVVILAWQVRRGAATEVHAAMPQRGGWLTDRLTTRVGEALTLRLVSDDVVHGFAIGGSDFEPVDLLPGQPVEISLTFDKPGTYTFYCTRWCGPDHWRMRGTVIVSGDAPAPAEAPDPPLYLQLGLDLDAPREEITAIPAEMPSALRAAPLAAQITQLPNLQYRAISPAQLWNDIRITPQAASFSDQEIWDIVAWLWQGQTSPQALAEGEALYQRDCAACHGISGAGDGAFAPTPPAAENSGERGHVPEAAADFSDPARMLSASPALLQGKILRGGMGTGMPSWGLIYTEEQTWNLVDYLWSFQYSK